MSQLMVLAAEHVAGTFVSSLLGLRLTSTWPGRGHYAMNDIISPFLLIYAGLFLSAFIVLCIGIQIVWNGYSALIGSS
jgi:hypothetical protein